MDPRFRFQSGATVLNNIPLRVIQLTDLHLDSPAKRLHERDGTTEDTLRQVLERVRAEPKDLVLCTGDLADTPSIEAYAILRELLVSLDCPVHCLPGNHDDPALARDVLRGPNISWNKHFFAGAWRFVLLDTWQAHCAHGTLNAPELHFLEHCLGEPDSSPAMVCLHHHPAPTGSPWMDSLMLTNPDELFNVVDRHPHVRGLLWGHIHQEFDAQRGKVRLLGSPSTCMQLVKNSLRFAVENLPPAFRRLTLGVDGSIETEVVYCES